MLSVTHVEFTALADPRRIGTVGIGAKFSSPTTTPPFFFSYLHNHNVPSQSVCFCTGWSPGTYFIFRPPLPPSIQILSPSFLTNILLFPVTFFSSQFRYSLFNFHHHNLSEFERLQVAFGKDVNSRCFFSKARFVDEQPLAEQEESL